MSQPIRKNMTLVSRWGLSLGVSLVAIASSGLCQTAIAQTAKRVTMPVNAEMTSETKLADSSGIVIPVISPNSWEQQRPSETPSNFPRLSLADILLLEPNLDPEKARPAYVQTAPQILDQGYKVVVETKDAKQEEQVRSLMPEAFRTTYDGRTMLQVGLFRDRANAEEIRQSLSNEGLQAIIVDL